MATQSPSKAHAGPLLSLANFDDDASSLRSISDQEDDSEDDEVLYGARTSRELAEHDLSVLKEEEDREKLLSGGAKEGFRRIFSGDHSNRSMIRIGRREEREYRRQEKREEREHRRQERREKRGQRRGERGNGRRGMRKGVDEEGELMFEMEEGGPRDDTSSESSRVSSEVEMWKSKNLFGEKVDICRRRLSFLLADIQQSRRLRFPRFAFVHLAVIVLFGLLLFGAYKMTRKNRPQFTSDLLSNGTATFAPTTILISLDGFRADFLDRGLTPTLNSFIAEGISPKYMLPSFPSVTFPNHFTLVTGLYPESHGIVGNSFWDPVLKEEFFYTDPARSLQAKWWGGEPLWVTAESQGIRSAIHMWPGSEAHIGGVEPAFVDKYNGTEILARKVDRVLALVDLPGLEKQESALSEDHRRPQFIAAYVPVVDADGHKFGPNSTEIRTTINNVDTMLGDLFAGLKQRNLTDIVNIVVVSDHGMATTSTDRLIQLDDLIDVNVIEHLDGWPLYGIRPKDPNDLRDLYGRLAAASVENPNFEVYLRDENMPERYHFSNNARIAPLWIVPKAGWAIVTKDEFDVAKAKETGEIYRPRGLHGYDHEHPLMRAIFAARGPAFPHKPNSRVEVFQNTEVYNIICDSLQLTPKPNNGTLRLPLKPVGLHSDPDAPFVQTPDDPPPPPPPLPTSQDPSSLPAALASTSVEPFSALSPSTSLLETPSSSPALGVDIPDPIPTRPTVPTPVPSDNSESSPDQDETNDGDGDAGKDKDQDQDATKDKDNETEKWWAYIKSKLEDAKHWAEGQFGSENPPSVK
ncbi:MAG: hypothetical protein M1819_004919 [Sarea resinae]|nr:MAG: hypothetical protein M1819_004919 [Sarea resinae]